jgi:hypothetical protein
MPKIQGEAAPRPGGAKNEGSTYYFQPALIEGHWRIINILSKAKPAPSKQG